MAEVARPAVPASLPLEISGARVLPDRPCELIQGEEAIRALETCDDFIWVNIVAHDLSAAEELLRKRLHYHELAVEDALSPYERPQLHTYKDFVFFNIPTVRLKEHSDRYAEVAFFLSDRHLVTVSTERLAIIEDWHRRWSEDAERIAPKPALLLHTLVDAIIDDFFPVLDRIEDAVDELADIVFAGETNHARDILALKRRVLEFRRRISPVRDVLNGLLRRDVTLIPESTRPYFQDVYEHTIRLAEMADVIRDTLASVLDLHLSTVSNNLNEIVKKMTVVATVLMIGSFVAGVYGMNFEFMPELHWRYGYPFALSVMAVLTAVALWFFRRYRWL